MYLSVGSWLPRDFTILYICSEASVWALMVAGALLVEAGLWWLWCARPHLSDSTKHLCSSALILCQIFLGQAVWLCQPIEHSTQSSRAGWRVCTWTALGKQCCLAVQSSTDQQLLVGGLKRLLAPQNALRNNCKGCCRSWKTFWLKCV